MQLRRPVRHSSQSAFFNVALFCGTMVAAGWPIGSPALAQATVPSYATGEERIHGRIASFDGKYHLEVRDDRGFIDNVDLHAGTIINPTGLRLAVGQSVTIMGQNSGQAFAANEIDTAYTRYGGPRYGYGYGYAPGYVPYAYRAYPAFGVGFRERGFGFRGWF